MQVGAPGAKPTRYAALFVLASVALASGHAAAHGIYRDDSDPVCEVAPLLSATSPVTDPAWEAKAEESFTTFESGQVRPLALSPNGKLLFAVNTPDARLEVFRVTGVGLKHRASIPVGLEPVAVAARSDREIWVVNHLSDSVSIVRYDDGPGTGRVKQTLAVGDEPRDIVFAGRNKSRAFITTAHRGQNHPLDPQLAVPGVGRADVWVYDVDEIGPDLNGTPNDILTFFTDTPRALAVSPDGSRVYVAGFHTGNKTSTVFRYIFPSQDELFVPTRPPYTNHEGYPAPTVSSIVQFDGAHWVDDEGNVYDDLVKLNLPDKDVFTIDANADVPRAIGEHEGGIFTSVGTVLFNMVVNPVTGAVYVSNTDANNLNRFEGPGEYFGKSIRGNLVQSRITILKDGSVLPRDLNKHIDHSAPPQPIPNAINAKSLAFPQDMAVTADGSTLYVAALGSNKVGVFSTTELEADTFEPSESAHIALSAGGPTGVVLDEARRKLYVLTRFDNGISVIDTATRTETSHVRMFNPEPARVTRGRRLLYDASLTSSNGDQACASCHVYGDVDSLAWDLGNPDGDMLNNPGPFRGLAFGLDTPLLPDDAMGVDIPELPLNMVQFHPMKGPMTTQSLRGMDNHGAMHWRGDRTGGNDEPSAQPNEGTFDEVAAFKKFNGAFVELLGRDSALTEEDMQAFADFALEIMYPPNPIRALDNSLTPDQAQGMDDFLNFPLADGTAKCVDCHKFDRDANAGFTKRPGFFGGDGVGGFVTEPQTFKVPHLRNLYQKIGRFGFAFNPLDFPAEPGSNDHMGDQIRGFGFLHDGGYDTVARFVTNFAFQNHNLLNKRDGGRQIQAFLLAFDSNLFPIVGQQVTYTNATRPHAGPRVDLLISQANKNECELVARTHSGGEEIGYLYKAGLFYPSQKSGSAKTDAELRLAAQLASTPITYMCAPPGNGIRLALDRDLDGVYDRDEVAKGTNPGDPTSR